MNLWYKKFQKVSKKEKKKHLSKNLCVTVYAMHCDDCFMFNIILWIIIFKGGRNIMNIGNQILSIRKEHQLTQAEFGKLFHIT